MPHYAWIFSLFIEELKVFFFLLLFLGMLYDNPSPSFLDTLGNVQPRGNSNQKWMVDSVLTYGLQ